MSKFQKLYESFKSSKDLDSIKENIDKSLEDTIKKIKDATERNDHNEALILLYRDIFKDEKYTKEMEKIRDEHMKVGHMTDEMSKKVYKDYHVPAMKRLKTQFNKDVYEKIHDAF